MRSRTCTTTLAAALLAMLCIATEGGWMQDQPTRPAKVAVDPPAAAGAAAAKLTTIGQTIYLTWIEPLPAPPAPTPDGIDAAGRDTHRLAFSTFVEGRWTEPQTIVARSNFFINWADVPAIAQAKDGTLYAQWLEKPTGANAAAEAYNAMIARSSDAGKTWKSLGKINDDNTMTEHGFVSLVPEGEGDGVRAFWLDGRDMAAAESHAHGAMSTMALRTALIGTSIGASEVLDPRVCECCNTSAAVTGHGPVILYRDRSDQDDRDISIIRRDKNSAWTQPKATYPDEWQISVCPVNGPAADARGNQVLAGWYTAPDHKPRVQAALSGDGGASFSKPVVLDDDSPTGRVAVVLDRDGTGIVCWIAGSGVHAAIRLGRIVTNGRLGEPVVVARLIRENGFPSIARVGDNVLVLWTEASQPTRLRAVLMPF